MAEYNDVQKSVALARLMCNGGNVKRTAEETKIPEHTLRRWRDAHDYSLMKHLQHKMTEHAVSLANGLLDNENTAPLNQRASALGLLFDRLLKLEDRESALREGEPSVIEVIFRDPDGSQHDTPFWKREGTDVTDDESED